MKIIGDTQIVRSVDEQGYIQDWEIPVAYNVEEMYKGTEEPDDPSECKINELVEVLKDVGPFRRGDMLCLTEDERHDLEDEELQNQLS